MNRKGQVVMEYIHTYGWILLVVMVISGVVLYYNMSRPQYLVPVECSFLSGIECLDAVVDETLLSIELVNGLGFAISNMTLTLNGTCNSTANTSDINPYGNPNVLQVNQQATVVFECQNLTNMKVSERITLLYRSVETDKMHIKVGKLQIRPGG